ncbi:hypothetical protein H4R19_000127 [Coemansia spiralis]|nr:hypothetical protein H4R19_000127 [Coemansia spiralis]
MDIQALPYDVLRLVLNWAGAHKPGDEADFARVLPLLAVCRSWRELAPPAIYRSVCAVGRPDGESVDGSIVLVHTPELARHVNRLHVTISNGVDPLEFMDNLLAMMSATRPVWSNVRRLLVEIDSSAGSTFTDAELDAAMANWASTTLGLMRSVLPGITKIDVRDCFRWFGNCVGGRVCDLYAAQLVHICSYEYLPLSAPAFSPEMTHLELSFNMGDVTRLPQTCAASLRFLFFDRFPNDFSWLPFKDDADARSLVFERLETFVAYHGRDIGTVPRIATKLHFPRLRKLSLFGVPGNSSLLANSVFPKKMYPLLSMDDTRIPRCITREI